MSDTSTAPEGVEAETEAEVSEATETDQEEVEATEAEEETVEEAEESEEEAEDTEGDEEPEVDSFDFGGNKLELPKGSVPDELREKIEDFTKGIWGDYTRKSQDVAERSKSIEAREQAVEKLSNLNGEALNLYSKGLALRSELEQLSQVDLNAMWQSDPDQARRISDRVSQKQAEFNSIVSQVNQKESELTSEQQAELARRRDEGRQVVEKRIKGASEKIPEIVGYMVENYGLDRKEAEDNWPLNPTFTEVAYKAMLYDRMKSQTKPKKPAPKQAQPVKPMKAKGTAKPNLDLVKDADKLSPDEWMRRRNRQLAKRGG